MMIAITGGALAASALPRTSFAKAPLLGAQVPAHHRFMLGKMEATILSDGLLNIGDPGKAPLFTNMPPAKFVEDLEAAREPTAAVALDENVLLINSGGALTLFDTGMGDDKSFGDSTGKLLVRLTAAGIDRKDIDNIVLTHAHSDHCFGVAGVAGTANFPNAKIHLAQPDFDFWTDEAKLSNAMLKPFIEGARKRLLPLRDRMVWVKDGQEILPGVQAIAAPGHTVGHMVYVVTSEGRSLCFGGDIIHHRVMLTNPRLEFIYDTDGKEAVRSRIRVLDMLAAQRIPLMAYHLPWPGLVHIVKDGDGYRHFPLPLRETL